MQDKANQVKQKTKVFDKAKKEKKKKWQRGEQPRKETIDSKPIAITSRSNAVPAISG